MSNIYFPIPYRTYVLFSFLTAMDKPEIEHSLMDHVYTKDMVIRFSETDNRGRLKVVSLFDCFQDVASQHALSLKLSGRDLMTRNYTWVILKYNVRITKLPKWNVPVTVRTWRYPHKNLYELRELDLMDDKGNMLVRALSCWVMMDLTSRKPVRLGRFIPPDLMENQRPVEDDFSKQDPLLSHDRELSFRVRMQDIDYNNHVNNSVYVGWAVETVPADIHRDYTLSQIEVAYKNEIAYGHRIHSRIRKEAGNGEWVFHHSITGGDHHTELTRLKTTWIKG